MRLREILRIGLVALLVASPSVAQPLAGGSPVWSGSVRCDIEIKGTGYANHQTHTWTLTGVAPANGSALDYPATWSVTGDGFQQAAPNTRAGAWKTQGSAPGVRMAIFVRQADQRLVVLLRHSLLNAPNGTTGAISAPVYEWRPFPTISDAATSTHMTGSSVTPITERLNPPQPLGSQGQAACTWDLVQSAGGAAAPVAPAAGAVAAPRAGGAPSVPTASAPAAPVRSSAQTGTIAEPPRAADTVARLPATSGAAPPAPPPASPPPPGADGMPTACATASGKTVSVARGQTSVVTGALAAAGSADWLVVTFAAGATVHLTIGNAAAASDASDFQVQAFSKNCSSMIVMTTGTGTKSLDFPDSGPHDVIVKIEANPWKVATPTYTLKLEGR